MKGLLPQAVCQPVCALSLTLPAERFETQTTSHYRSQCWLCRIFSDRRFRRSREEQLPPAALPAQAAGKDKKDDDRGEVILSNLPAKGTSAYKELLRIAGSKAKGQILSLTKSEVWKVPKSLIGRVKAHCEKKLKEAELKVEKIVLGADGPKGVERADDL